MGKARIRVGNRRLEIDGVEVTASAAEINTLASAVLGTGAASKVVGLDSSGNFAMPATGMFGLSRAALAAAGTTAADAAVITTQIVLATASDNAKGVALPAAAATGGPILVVNTVQDKNLLVYPVNGGNDNINALSEDAAFTMRPGQAAWFIPTSATQWYAQGLAGQALLTVDQAVTTTADGTTTGAILPATTQALITSASATNQAALPGIAANSLPVGHSIRCHVTANGLELITLASSNETINGVDSDGTNQLDIPANTAFECRVMSATAWSVMVSATATPDND